MFSKRGIVWLSLTLSHSGAMLTSVATAWADTVEVATQSEFDVALQQAIMTGQPNTINVTTSNLITANTGLVLPGQALPLNLNFIGSSPVFGVGFDSASTGGLTLGTGTNITFTPGSSAAVFRVGSGNGSSGTVTMTGGTITGNPSSSTYLSFSMGRDSGTGTFNQSGGTFNLDGGAFQVGVASGQGTYNLSGTGVVDMGVDLGSGGTIYLGDGAGGIGMINISGSAKFTSGHQAFIGQAGGEGTITQDGLGSQVVLNEGNWFGTNADPSQPGGTGIYNLVNGSLDITNTAFAAFGNLTGASGILNQSGGSLATLGTGLVYIGQSGAGQYNMSGGTATFSNGLNVALFSGSTGDINQTGGVLTLSGGKIQFGAGSSTYNLNGGVLQIGGTNPIAAAGGTHQFNLGGGTIQVVNSALVSSIDANLTTGISTIDTNGLGATWSGVLSGNGALAKAGDGTLILTDANLYTGGTTISGGTLQIGNGGGTGSITGDILNNGALVFNTSNTSTFTSAISGSGILINQGAGILNLSGANTYDGATLVNTATLQAGAVNAFSSNSAFNIASAATLDLDNYNNAIGSLLGSGSVTLGSATLTTGHDGTSTTFSGNIDGTGGLTKSGLGAQTLTGASTYSGSTNVNEGALIVNGSLSSAVSVNSGGTLKGNGALGGLIVTNRGIVAPGNSIGTLSVASNASFGAGSIYQAEVNATGQTDKIVVNGATTLSGGTVQVLAQQGNYDTQTVYTLLGSTSGVTGTFSNVTSNLVFLTPILSYDANDVFLTLKRNTTFLSSLAQTRNQLAVATAFNGVSTDNPLFLAVAGQTASGARQAFDALSGEIHASVATTLVDDSLFMREAILGRLRQASFSGKTGSMAAFGSNGPVLAQTAKTTDMDAVAAPHHRRTSDFTWWSQGISTWGRFNSNGNAASVHRDLAGYFTGVDRWFGDHWLAGIASGYSNSSIDVNARASSANIDTAHFAVYADANYSAFNFRSGAAGFWSFINTDRSIQFPGFFERAKANSGAGLGQVFGELGYARALGAVAIEPFAGLAYVHLNTNSFNELGQEAALTGSTIGKNIGYSSLGLRLATRFVGDNKKAIVPHVSTYWQHLLGNLTPDISLAFLSTGPSFTIAGIPMTRDAAIIDSGLDFELTPSIKLGVSYFGQLSASLQDSAVKGSFTWRF